MITYTAPGECPVCGEGLEMVKLRCMNCNTTIEGRFSPCLYCKMTADQRILLEALIKTRGNLRDMEGILNLSYPTIRNRLDTLSELLFPNDSTNDDGANSRQQVLDMLEQGAIQPAEASQLLKRMK